MSEAPTKASTGASTQSSAPHIADAAKAAGLTDWGPQPDAIDRVLSRLLFDAICWNGPSTLAPDPRMPCKRFRDLK